MMRVWLKDLRELLAAPVFLIALITWSGIVLIITSMLPLPNSTLKFAIGVPAEICEASAEPSFNCPFPQASTLRHAINDVPGTELVNIPDLRRDVFRRMEANNVDVAIVWHAFSPNFEIGPNQANGSWIVYSSPRSKAGSAQIRFAIRQAQASALLIDNARGEGENPYLPTVGTADVISEWIPQMVLRQGDNASGRLEENVFEIYEPQDYYELRDYEEGPYLADEIRVQIESARLAAQNSYREFFGKDYSNEQVQAINNALETSIWFEFPYEERNFGLLKVAHGDLLIALDETDLFSTMELDFFFMTGASILGRESAQPTRETVIDLQDSDEIVNLDTHTRTSRNYTIPAFHVLERDAPSRNTSGWMVPGMLMIIAAAIAFMLTAAGTVREREFDTEHLLLRGKNHSWFTSQLAKTLAPVSIAAIATLIMMLLAQNMLGFQIKSAPYIAFALLVVMMLSAALQGLAVGMFLSNQSSALAASGAYLISLLLFGGVFIPIEGAHWIIGGFADSLPTGFVNKSWSDWMTWNASISLSDFMGPCLVLVASAALAIVSLRSRQMSV